MPDGSATPNATVALRLAEAFARHGVTTTFGQSLPSAFHLAAPNAGISQTVYRQENMGGTMADGYARISHKVGVVTAQNGPAATLLVPPLAEAMKVSIPVIALVQEVTRDAVDKNAFQELDHVKLFEGVAKFVRRIDRADRLEDYVDMAFTAATSGRPGPAVLLLPADLLLEKAAAASHRRANLGTFPLDRTLADPKRIEEAAALLAQAERPVIIAGGGIHISDAAQELAALQQDGHLPVATTFMGKGSVDETHALSIGVVGNTMGLGARSRDLKPLISEADVVLLVGNRTNQNGTDSWTLYPRNARYIHIDPDPSEIGRNYEALRLTGDAKLTLAALREAMLKQDLKARAAARPALEATIAKAVEGWRKLVADVTTRDGGPVRPERVATEIDKRLPADGIMVADASYSSNWINIYMTAKRAGQRFLSPRGLAGLGWGVPLAIGAQVAAPGKRVVALVGDGGFGHSWAELETLFRLQVPVTVVVLNNGILGFQKHAEDAKYGDHTIACDFADVDHSAIARACGISGVRVTRGEDVGPALDAAFASGKPALIEVLTDPNGKPPLNLYSGHYPEPF
ncbi:acetolactate synthase catalytic subunit [Roseococcus sp. YIM B11640]|uniref:acetolactate synthase catalytic subunit n=1 Tax=Roseococcus sp. YIM B11640 TaxID=3133973 RepID=UPI003C7C777F